MRILVVDDERAIRFALEELLGYQGFDVSSADNGRLALAHLQDHEADLIISDLSMPEIGGLELLEEAKARYPETLFVLMTAYGDERTAVGALKRGAWDYIPKPFDNDEIVSLCERAREVLALRSENQRLRNELADRFHDLIGQAPAMRDLFANVRRVGMTDSTVLITGESGTGKELVARAIHDESRRAKSAFVAVNCSALPSELVESELFGHVRGAFTGADRDRKGLFESADRGTIFLDEIGEMPIGAQAKLLRVIEQREVVAVGSTKPLKVDVRIVAATNRDLVEMSKAREFREDLLYRLRVIELRLPPLRERGCDIIPLAIHFLADLAKRDRRKAVTLADDARAALLSHAWPGNVRELRNAVERAFVMSEGEMIEARGLPVEVTHRVRDFSAVDAVLSEIPFSVAKDRAADEFERGYLTAALEKNGHNVSETARVLGMHRQSLQKMLKRLGIEGRG